MIVVGAIHGEILGSTPTAIVLTEGALDRMTGAQVAMPDQVEPDEPTDVVIDGVRIAVADRQLVRMHADWVEHVTRVPAGTQVVATDTLAVTVSREDDRGLLAFGTVYLRILDATGPMRVLPLPIGDEPFRVVSLAAAHVVVIATASSLAWLRYESIAEIHALPADAIVRFADAETSVYFATSPGVIARSTLGPGVRPRLDRLRAVIAPFFDRDAQEFAITHAFGNAAAVAHPALAAAKVLFAHVQLAPDDSRAICTKEAVARATRDAGWHLVTMPNYEAFALRLDDHQRRAIVDEELLVLERTPRIDPPTSGAEVRTQLLALIRAAPEEVVLEGAFTLRLSIRAALLLERLADDARR